MKRFLILLFMVIFLLSTRAYALNFYCSLSPVIALENFDLKGEKETIDKEESLGFNFKAGLKLGYYISLELDYEFVDGFKGYLIKDNMLSYTDIQIYTLMPMMKTSIGRGKYKNYLSTGLGYMHADRGFTKTDMCWKLGIGLDYFFTDNLFLSSNINYMVGLGDLKYIEYYTGTLGLGFIF